MSRTNFENLRVYNLAEELVDEIWKIALRWDKFARDTVGKQIVRSADSIGANIAEGTGRHNFQDNHHPELPSGFYRYKNLMALMQESFLKAVHRAYAKRALMKLPSLEDYEHRAAEKIETSA